MYLYSEQNPDAEILSAAKPCSCHPISRGAQGPSA
jgi:hypothetical protein